MKIRNKIIRFLIRHKAIWGLAMLREWKILITLANMEILGLMIMKNFSQLLNRFNQERVLLSIIIIDCHLIWTYKRLLVIKIKNKNMFDWFL